jgi:CBS domain-containing protein
VSAGGALEAERFLRCHPPFSALPEKRVEAVAEAAEVEHLSAGTTIFSEGEGPVEHLRVIRSGAVEIVSDGRVLDLLGEGELFGHASMLSGFPTGFEARAAEDTVCYRIPADAAQGLLTAPEGLRFVARSLLERNLADQPVGTLLRGTPVVCGPSTPVREAARLMTAAGATSAVVDLAEDGIGILTDRDLRSRVVAGGLPVQAPVSAAMTTPGYSCTPDRPAGEVLLEMLDRGLRHFPVISTQGTILGVVEDSDLVAVRTRS